VNKSTYSHLQLIKNFLDDEIKEDNVDGAQLHDWFQFLCSHHTSRIYLYDKVITFGYDKPFIGGTRFIYFSIITMMMMIIIIIIKMKTVSHTELSFWPV
jgi:hypothetical protein